MNLSSNGRMYLMATMLNSAFLEVSWCPQAIALSNTKLCPQAKENLKNSLTERMYL